MVVTGTPGIGKTVVSEKLARRLAAIHINVGEVVKKNNLTSGYDEKRQTLIADTTKVKKKVAQMMAGTRKTIIVDGHYAAGVLSKDQVTKVFVLRCHPEQLMQRMMERGFHGSKLKENLAAEILDVCLTDAIRDVGADKICELNTTGRTPEAVVDDILLILKSKKGCEVGVVDWLGQLEMEKSLEQYLQEF